ncbi:MAG TPA: hypothetical protein PKE49_01100 [Leptospiraceae bacterium]|nr:hypothetical protein [Leptospirales bacterium]HMU83397.1 hypothetical protein [Leptospiraceae bacterium]HMX55083.1 hypothetical protein [Leptospiraceae bacterium]HMY45756.1 hypothetical protein [Leptospiraceae bacterium]HMZ36131.1 hypothetical protein [Leptospiraceae bacterium]
MRAVLFIFLSCFSATLGAEPDGSKMDAHTSINYRITNRKYVSHILLERSGGINYVTLLTTHPMQWAFHSESHALKYACGKIPDCMDLMSRLDECLNAGKNLNLHLDGERIIEIQVYE